MTPSMRALLAVLIFAIIVAAWMGRITAESAPTGVSVVTDHWLGNVYSCNYAGCIRLYPSEK
jgi:hypothetical protein